MNFNIEKFLDLTGYEEIRKDRRKGSGGSNEFFTPYEIVKKMAGKIPEEDWSNPDKTFCEPCFGNGQFVIYIIWNRLQHGIDWKTALETLYGVELMQDNVYETHERIIKLFDALGIDYDEDEAMDIMLKNLVCSDFFEWDFENWCPIEEKKPIKHQTDLFEKFKFKKPKKVKQENTDKPKKKKIVKDTSHQLEIDFN